MMFSCKDTVPATVRLSVQNGHLSRPASPLSAGEPVLRARAILALAWETPRTFDDEGVCISERSRPETAAKSRRLKVYPNPATDRLTVEYSGGGSREQTFLLFNALGQLVKTTPLPVEQNTIRISLDSTPGGIYWYCITGTDSPVFSGKVIINR